MFSDAGDYIGGGQPRLYHPGNGSVTASSDGSWLSVGVSGGTEGDYFTLEFAAPPGRALAPGVYVGAQRASFREAGRPGIDVSGSGRGCNEQAGSFEVRDLEIGSDGVVERLWLVYEQHCEGGSSALWGEVRVGIPAPAAPAVVRWPAVDLGVGGTAVPVTVVADRATTIGSVAVEGEHAADFPLRVDECGGRSLAAGASCQVWLRHQPGGAGVRSAVLRLGGVGDVPLQGFAYGGRTRVVMHSDPGDYIGQGRDYDYRPGNARIGAGGSRRLAYVGVVGTDGSDFGGTFEPGDGDILAPGRYAGATRYPFNGPEPGLDVSGSGRGCNTLEGEFTVRTAAFDDQGDVRQFGVDFVQHCEGGEPALRGTMEFRVGDTSPDEPWLLYGPEPRDEPAPEPPDPPSAPPPPPPSGSPPVAAPVAEPILPPPPTASAAAENSSAVPVGRAPVVPRTAVQNALCAARRFARRSVRRGTARANRLVGTRRADVLLAGAGNDTVLAGRGDDCIEGGAGRDVLLGGAGDDVIDGGPGRDRIDCGPGRDVARAQRGERTRRCEVVIRPRSPSAPSAARRPTTP
jgi:hypothetical protein